LFWRCCYYSFFPTIPIPEKTRLYSTTAALHVQHLRPVSSLAILAQQATHVIMCAHGKAMTMASRSKQMTHADLPAGHFFGSSAHGVGYFVFFSASGGAGLATVDLILLLLLLLFADAKPVAVRVVAVVVMTDPSGLKTLWIDRAPALI
jgi:hypothetical protein